MALPGLGAVEDLMVPRPGGHFAWHSGFQSVPDIPAALIAGREDVDLNAFIHQNAYDRHAVRPERMEPYVTAMRQAGALAAGLRYYQEHWSRPSRSARTAKCR